jgi:cysteinylglycine-S-conjugate dipeptidase
MKIYFNGIGRHAGYVIKEMRSNVRGRFDEAERDLTALVRLASVSSDPARRPDVEESAWTIASMLAAVGSPRVVVVDDIPEMPPAVIAHYPPPAGQPTLLLYAHHDVQPADGDGWRSQPFEPTLWRGRLYGRGTADDKAAVVAHLAALRAYDGRPPVGVIVFVEGEEEVGSPHLRELLTRHRSALHADVILLADSQHYDVGVPTLTTSLRGTTACIVEIRCLEENVHSGLFGGPIPDALTALCRLLATLHDERGNVAVEGLVSAPELGHYYPEPRFRKEAGLLPSVDLIGEGPVARRLWAQPAVTVLAVDAPKVDAASNVLTAAARAKVSLRIAPGDTGAGARDALARHLRRFAPWGADVSVTELTASEPFQIDPVGPAFDAARWAYGAAFDSPVVEIGSGGSVPFVAEFAAAFPDAPMLITSAGADPHSRTHGPDESVDLDQLERVAVAEALLMSALGNGAPIADDCLER